MNDSRPLKDEALIQMQYLEGEIRTHKEMDQALRDLAKSDGYDARRIMLTDEEMEAFINGQRRWEAMVNRFKDDVSPCEQNEPDEIVVTYEQEQPQALRKAAWFVVGVLVVLVLAILAGCEENKKTYTYVRNVGNVSTFSYDNHLFINVGQSGTVHHPDCPCKNIEQP